MALRALILQGAAARLADLRTVSREPLFGLYILGHFTTTIAFWMQRIAVGWLAWRLTESESWLGIIAFAELFPSILSSLVGGELADRFPRPRVMFFCQGGVALVSALLAFGHAFALLNITLLAGIMILLGVIGGMMLPARLAMPGLLVRPELLPSALALNSSTFNLSRLIGPALAAPLLLIGNGAAVFFCALAANLTFFLLLWRISTRNRRHRGPRASDGFLRILRDLFRASDLRAVIALQFAQGALIRPASELFPAFSDKVFSAGASGLSILNAAVGVGAIIGALTLSRPRADRDALRVILSSSAVLCASLAAFGAAWSFWPAAALMVLYGVTISASNTVALAYV
ncbi:MAG: MFS transporter, partial [Alphaproteobacteria bacterium]